MYAQEGVLYSAIQLLYAKKLGFAVDVANLMKTATTTIVVQ